MERRMLGVIVAGGGPPLEAIGIADDAALTPFAGKYRFIDFALATMRNSGASSIYVMAPLPGPELRAHLARGELAGHRSDPPLLLPLPGEGGQGRSNRLRQTLAGCRELIRTHQPETIVVLLADHILQLDLRQLADAHDDLRADVTLAALPVPVGEATSRTVLRVAGDQRVHEVQRSPVLPATAPGSRAFALSWAGDCSGPSDCSSIPDNGTKAASVGGVIAGYCLFLRTRRKKHEEEPEFGPGEADDQTILFGGDGEANKPSSPGAAGKN